MLHNIFEKAKKKFKLSKKPKTPLIIADIHEKNSLIISELYSSKQVRLKIKPLKIGDYLLGNTIIERKTTSDFVSSMINKRLIQQLKQMRKYKQNLLIIEGELEGLYKLQNPNAIRGFILSILTSYNIPIIFAQDSDDTVKYLITLAKQQLKPSTQPSFHSRIPKTTKEQKQYILQAFPNVGPKKAEKLLNKFKTLKSIFNASDEELKEILKNQARDFKDLIET